MKNKVAEFIRSVFVRRSYVLYVDPGSSSSLVERFLHETRKALRTKRVVALPSTFRLEEVPSRTAEE
jgi:hypothetical protein